MLGLEKSDFWPPLKGGWEYMHGYILPYDTILHALSSELNTHLEQHPDYINAKDEDDLLDFLEERTYDAGWQCPLIVFKLGDHTRDLPEALPNTTYALWSGEAELTSNQLQRLLAQSGATNPLRFQIYHPRFIVLGADFLLWLSLFIGLVWFLSAQCKC